MKSLIGEQQYFANRPPHTMVTRGVSIMSTGVLFDMRLPSTVPMMTVTYAPTGPPNWYPNAPVTADEIITRGAHERPYAMARPIHAPTRGESEARASAMKLRKSSPGILAI